MRAPNGRPGAAHAVPPLPLANESGSRIQDKGNVQASNQAQTADTYHSMGYQLRREGDYQGLLSTIQWPRIRAKPFQGIVQPRLLHDKIGDYEAAISDYTSSLRLEPHNAFAFYNRGISRDRAGNFEEAYDDFSKAIAEVPENPDFFHNRAFCSRKLGGFGGS